MVRPGLQAFRSSPPRPDMREGAFARPVTRFPSPCGAPPFERRLCAVFSARANASAMSFEVLRLTEPGDTRQFHGPGRNCQRSPVFILFPASGLAGVALAGEAAALRCGALLSSITAPLRVADDGERQDQNPSLFSQQSAGNDDGRRDLRAPCIRAVSVTYVGIDRHPPLDGQLDARGTSHERQNPVWDFVWDFSPMISGFCGYLIGFRSLGCDEREPSGH